MVLATALAIGWEAYLGWQNPHAPETPLMGVLLKWRFRGRQPPLGAVL